MQALSAAQIKAKARDLGFNLVGLIPALPSPRLEAYLNWIEAGYQAEMGYLARPDRIARRRDLNVILPGVRTLISVALDYHTLNVPDALLRDPLRGRIAAYAWNLDYHDLMTPRLEALAAWMQTTFGLAPFASRAYVDTGAILERSHAHSAGLGFVGKNTLLIHPRRGSYFFLGELLIDAAVDAYDLPGRESLCGSCQRCQSACPTNAFPAPYTLDARRCISYLTIEHKGSIDPALRPLMGNWVYGCDVCQAVCPFNRFATPSAESAFYPPHADRAAPLLADLLRLDDTTFAARFAGSPIARIKRERLVRNACVAAGNSGDPVLLPLLRDLEADPSALIREHATWAVQQLHNHFTTFT